MNIHILGIAGTMTAPLACYLKSLGHQVTGSDQTKIYPPVSTLLRRNHLPLITNLPPKIDLAIIGSSYKSFQNTRRQFQQIKKQNIPYLSATKYIAQHLIKKNSILVAGAYGKSTITSLLAWVLKNAHLNPSYMFGAIAKNSMPSLDITSSDWSIVEADESINGLDRQAKFLYYPVKYLIITSTLWEHKESYHSPKDNLSPYKKLIKKVPPAGLLIYNQKDSQLKKIIHLCRGKTIAYKTSTNYQTQLIGSHNLQNVSAAVTLCQQIKIKPALIKKSVASFLGLKRRLEISQNQSGILFIDDYAQSPLRLKSALQAVKKTFPKRQLKVFFEVHASFMQNKKSLTGLSLALKPAQEIVLSRLKYSPFLDKKNRPTAADFKKILGSKLKYLPLLNQIENHYQKTLKKDHILVHFSSGGQAGLKTFQNIIKLTNACHNTS